MASTTFDLLNGSTIDYEAAARREDNIMHQIPWVPATWKLYRRLWAPTQRRDIASLTAQHLGLNPERHHTRCVVQDTRAWIRGSFNVCIPVHVHDRSGDMIRKVLMRCPMSYKLAEDRYPGTVDEKIGIEVATYIWMQENCPELPIPPLLGFGFSDGRHFTHVRNQPFYVRWARALRRRVCAILGYPVPSQYVRVPSNYPLDTGYLLLGYIEPTTGQMLSATWEKQRHDTEKRQNLFRGLSRLLLSISRIPLPRIASWTFHDDGSISISNRPLTCGTMILEQDGAPRVAQKNQTYTCVEPYVSDMLTFHDGRFLAQPNAANDERDCRFQMAVQSLLRTISHHYYDRELRTGPFVMQFSDLHASNILVDSDWNISGLIDLEWICSRPAEMVDVPYWITGLGIDEVGDEENVEEYVQTREEFMTILEDEEKKTSLHQNNVVLSKIMRRSWGSKSCWFTHCLDSVNGMYALFDQHLRPQFVNFYLSEKMEVLISRFWRQRSDDLVAKKLKDKEQYLEELRTLFGETKVCKGNLEVSNQELATESAELSTEEK